MAMPDSAGCIHGHPSVQYLCFAFSRFVYIPKFHFWCSSAILLNSRCIFIVDLAIILSFSSISGCGTHSEHSDQAGCRGKLIFYIFPVRSL